jgi:hypothetical protein
MHGIVGITTNIRRSQHSQFSLNGSMHAHIYLRTQCPAHVKLCKTIIQLN